MHYRGLVDVHFDIAVVTVAISGSDGDLAARQSERTPTG